MTKIKNVNFQNWFSGSQVVDETGEPQILYHGTGADFKEFSYDFAGEGIDQYGSGFYFTTNPKTAEVYAGSLEVDNRPNIMPVYLKIDNAIKIDNATGESNSKEITKRQIKKPYKKIS